MRKSSFLLLPLLILLAASAFAANTGNRAVKIAILQDGYLLIETTGGWIVGAEARNVEVKVDTELMGTYIHLPKLPRALMGEDMVYLDEMLIYVGVPDLINEWQATIRKYLIERDKPRNVVPTVKDSQ